MTFEIAGFKKFVRNDVVIQAGFNAEIDAKIDISTVQETVTVTGESPVVDTRSTTLSASFTKEALDKIPNARDPWVILEQTPGMIMSGVERRRQPVGPADVVLGDGQQHEPAVEHQRRGDQRHRVGQLVADLLRLRLVRGNPDHHRRRDASQQGAGVQVNFITRSGSNKLHAAPAASSTPTTVLRQVRPARRTTSPTRMRNLGAGGGNPIQDIRDYGAQLGGPIKKNKAWFWGATSRQDVRRRRARLLRHLDQTGCQAVANTASNKDPSGAFVNSIQGIRGLPVRRPHDRSRTTTRGSSSRRATAHQTTFSYTYGDKYRSSRGCDAFHPLITCSVQTGPTIFYTTRHRWIVSNALTIIGQYTHIHEDWFLGFQNDGLKDVQAINWVDTDLLGPQQVERRRTTRSGRRTTSARTATTSPRTSSARDHSVKFGFAVPPLAGGVDQHGRRRRRAALPRHYDFIAGAVHRRTPTRSAASKRACTIAGVTYRGEQRRHGCDEANILRDADFTYTPVSAQRLHSGFDQEGPRDDQPRPALRSPARHRHAGRRAGEPILPAQLPAINFPGADSGARYNNWSPRGGITYDLSRQRQERLKASAGAVLRHRHVHRQRARADRHDDDAPIPVEGSERRQSRPGERAAGVQCRLVA